MGKVTRLSILALVAFAAGCLACRAAAQKPAAKPDYSKEAAVVEIFHTTAAFQNDGTSTRGLTMRVRINSDAGVQQYSVLVLPYASANEKVKIEYVRVTHPDGTVVETPTSSIQDESSAITRQAPEYSDYREKHVAVKGLGPGDVLEYHVQYQITKPLVPGQFWFGYNFDQGDICLDQQLQISVPEGRDVKIRSMKVQPTVTDQGGRRIYVWKTQNLKLQENPREYRSGRLPESDVLISSFTSWAQVGDWWKELEVPRVAPTAQIKAKAAALTKGLTTEEAKLRAIYSYVALNFHYIGISFGIGRYQPHAATDVLNNQYGDCKDQFTLLASLLKAAGIQAWPALINSQQLIDPSVPTPGQFDHVITVARLGQKMVWMDTTTAVAPLGLLMPTLQDKQALVVPDDKSPYLAETPAGAAHENFVRMDVDAQMDKGGTFTAKMQDTAGGVNGLIMRIAFRSVPEANWQKLVERLARLEGYGGTVSDVSVGSPEDTSHPFKWTYNYTRKDFPDWKNSRIVVGLPPMLLPDASDDKKKAGQPVILGPSIERHDLAKIKLPAGYVPTLPKHIDLVKPYAEYHASYTFANGTLEVKRDFITKKPEVAAANRKDYRDFYKAVSDDESRYVDLSNNANPAPSEAGSEEFQKLIRQVYSEAHQHHLHAALETANQALKLNPNSAYAWEVVAAVHMDSKEADQAIAAARKAVKIGPGDLKASTFLADMLRKGGKEDEVVQVWRDFVKHNPNNPQGHSNLAEALQGEKKYSEAIQEIQAAIKLDPKQWHYNVLLGDTLAKSGDKAAAASAYKKAASLSTDPEVLNDASYGLADAGLKLPEAERWATQAVEAVEKQTSSITLHSISKKDLGQMTVLSAYWDTLGWVYFREGKLHEARKYAAASFAIEQGPIIADHMGQIDAKLGRRSAAIREEAAAAEIPLQFKLVNGGLVRPQFDLKADGARGRLSRLVRTKAAFDSAINKVSDELAATRTFSVNKKGLPEGAADFYVLLSPAATKAEVKFVSGTDSLRAAAERLAAVNYYLLFPDKGPAKVIRRGALTCANELPSCDFVLYPAETTPRLAK